MNHDDHDERRVEDCALCQAELAAAIWEHAWMIRAARQNARNPYAPDPQAPEDDWTEDEDGYVRAPLSYENREGDPAFNGAFDKW